MFRGNSFENVTEMGQVGDLLVNGRIILISTSIPM